MNTHLHILEGHTNLYRVWKDAGLRDKFENIVNIFIDKIIRPNGELYWSLRSNGIPNTTDNRAGFWKCPYHNS